jgi:cell division protein FtsB
MSFAGVAMELTDQNKRLEAENKQLRARVTELEAQVDSLEDRLWEARMGEDL